MVYREIELSLLGAVRRSWLWSSFHSSSDLGISASCVFLKLILIQKSIGRLRAVIRDVWETLENVTAF